MTAVEDSVAAVVLDGDAAMTDAPTGIRGAEGFGLVFGRRTGAKASAADHPVFKSGDLDKMAVTARKRGSQKGNHEGEARRGIFQLTSSRVLWRTDEEIPAEGLAAGAVDPGAVVAGCGWE